MVINFDIIVELYFLSFVCNDVTTEDAEERCEKNEILGTDSEGSYIFLGRYIFLLQRPPIVTTPTTTATRNFGKS